MSNNPILAKFTDVYGLTLFIDPPAISFIGPAKKELNKGEPCSLIIVDGNHYIVKGEAERIVWDLGATVVEIPRVVSV